MGLQSIAICSTGEVFGGVERHILGLLEGLHARNLETQLILFNDGELATLAHERGLKTTLFPGNNRSLLSTSRALARFIGKHGIQLVHSHGYKATVYCALAQRMHSFALVKTEHGLPEPMTGVPLRRLRDRFYHFLDRTATRHAASCVIYVTEDLSHAHLGRYPRLAHCVIPNGVENLDREQYARPPDLVPEYFNAVIVGRLESVKGHRIAIEALGIDGSPADAHLYFLGTGPDRALLEAAARAGKVGDRVHFLGFRRNVYDYIAHCDALLMPSLHEGLPYTLLEAMALGKAIVASDVGGIPEVLQDGVNALLIPPRDPNSLSNRLMALRNDSALRTRLGEAARQLHRQRYSLEIMTSRYLEQYDAALRSYSGKRS